MRLERLKLLLGMLNPEKYWEHTSPRHCSTYKAPIRFEALLLLDNGACHPKLICASANNSMFRLLFSSNTKSKGQVVC